MKKYLSVLLAITAINIAHASSPKEVTIPFYREALLSNKHSGLKFNYKMNNNKIVACDLSNVYKAWFEYTTDGVMRESGVFGDNQTVVFGSRGKDSTGGMVSYYRADATGEIMVFETESNNNKNATVTCFYAADNSPKNQ